MANLDSLLEELAGFIGSSHLTLPGDMARNCFCFDWRTRDEDLSMNVEDMFGDGSPEGFEMSEDDTLIPFALIGMLAPDDDDDSGQVEGVLFFDLGNGDQIIHIEVDGTALFDNPKVVAAKLAELTLAPGPAPEA